MLYQARDFFLGWLGQVSIDVLNQLGSYWLGRDIGFWVHSCSARSWTHITCCPVVLRRPCFCRNTFNKLLCAFNHGFEGIRDVFCCVSHKNEGVLLACANGFPHGLNFFGCDAIGWHFVRVEDAANSTPELGAVRKFCSDSEIRHKFPLEYPSKAR